MTFTKTLNVYFCRSINCHLFLCRWDSTNINFFLSFLLIWVSQSMEGWLFLTKLLNIYFLSFPEKSLRSCQMNFERDALRAFFYGKVLVKTRLFKWIEKDDEMILVRGGIKMVYFNRFSSAQCALHILRNYMATKFIP